MNADTRSVAVANLLVTNVKRRSVLLLLTQSNCARIYTKVRT